MKAKGTVLVTGAAGKLGTVLSTRLPALGWLVRGVDVAPAPAGSQDYTEGSVESIELLESLVAGVDAIVHLGGIANPGADWSSYVDVNIRGTWNVLEAARRQHIKRVTLASSNHAVGYAPKGARDLPGSLAPRPDSLYGVSKAAMESLAIFYADEYGLEPVTLRIGSCLPEPRTLHHLASWLSYDDFVRLIQASIEGPWAGAFPIWGVSRNTRRWWSLAEGERIGYDPKDDAEQFADTVEAIGIDEPFVSGARPPFDIPVLTAPEKENRP